MPTSVFFNNYNNRQEQDLVEDLVNESLYIKGFDAYYIPNDNDQARDLLYNDDPLKKFERSYTIACYLSNSRDPGMNNDFFSKFGLEVRNNVRVLLGRREFSKRVPQDEFKRPREGDLLYIPFLSGTGELYSIKFCNDTDDYFLLGRQYPYYWELELELFKYSHEEISTGIEDIDMVETNSSYSINYQLSIGAGDYELQETVYQGNTAIDYIAKGNVQEWDKSNKILRVSNMYGEFANGSIIRGNSSGAMYILQSYDPQDEPKIENSWDNKVIEDYFDNIMDTSETNPLGNL